MSTHTDRLYLLSTYTRMLREQRFSTPESVLSATDERLMGLEPHREPIQALIREGQPDVLLALFPAPLDWSVAPSAKDGDVRHLDVYQRTSRHSITMRRSLRYAVDDDGSDERAAWATLRDTLRKEAE